MKNDLYGFRQGRLTFHPIFVIGIMHRNDWGNNRKKGVSEFRMCVYIYERYVSQITSCP